MKIQFAILSCLMLLGSGMLLSGCRNSQASGEKVVRVSVMEVSREQSAYSRHYLGTVFSKHIRLLTCPYGGTVVELNVRTGQRVAKNQQLARIDSPTAKSMKKTSDATLAQARDGYERARKVYEAGGLSEIKWMDVQTKLAQAESAAEMADNMVEDCKVKAPWDATVNEVHVALNDDLAPMSRVVSLVDEKHLEVAIGVPESEFSKIYEGMKAVVVIPALNDLTLKAKVSDLDVQASPVSHSYLTHLLLDRQPEALKAGMACKVSLGTDLLPRMVVPANVVKVDDEGRYVWVVNDEDLVEKRHVTVKGFASNGVNIAGGLLPGERVIVEGTGKVSSGMKVSPVSVKAL